MSVLSRTRILVVDDDEEMARLIALILQDDETEILMARDGQEGLQKALQENPDVVVTDLMMPEMDGLTLTEKILDANPTIPVIVVTAYGSMNAAIRALRLGAFDFITKPFNRTDVRKTVTKAKQEQIVTKYKLWEQTIAGTLGSSRNPQGVAQTFLNHVGNALQVQYGLLWWTDGTNLVFSQNTETEAPLEAIIASARQAGLDVQLARETPNLIFEPGAAARRRGIGTLIGVPLATQHRLEAILLLAHEQADYFNHHDLAFLEEVAPLAALNIDSAWIYTKLENSNKRLASLQRINALTYNANLPLNRGLRLATEGIRQNLGYADVVVCLYEKKSDNLVIRTAAGELDRFLQRHGDTPTRRISFSGRQADNPFSRTFQRKKSEEGNIAAWVAAFEGADAADMAATVGRHQAAHYITLPLWQQDEVIGVLGIVHTQFSPLPDDDHTLVSNLANQVALIIRNSALYQAERQGRREMEALYQAGLVITSSLSPEEVLRTIIEQLHSLTLFEGYIIGRWDQLRDAETIEIYLEKTENGWVERVPSGTLYPLRERPMVDEALAQRRLRVVRPDDPNLHPAEQFWMSQAGVKLRLIIPLIIRNSSIGVLELMTAYPDRHLTDQVSRITQGLAAQAAIALENARLHQYEMKRLEHEMDLAHRIQVSLLPHEIPEVPGLSIAARSVSARLVGGDFYRYLSLPNNKFGVVIGDVSGKGVPSALYMAITITAMDTQIRRQSSPDLMLDQLNNILYPRMQANRMNTGLCIVIYDPDLPGFQVANAGMIAPFVSGEQQADWLEVTGLPIGVISDAHYHSLTLAPIKNTTVILASDGIIEAQNTAGELYGFARFQEAAARTRALQGSQEILEAIWTDVADHVGSAEPHDDMTLVIIRTRITKSDNGSA